MYVKTAILLAGFALSYVLLVFVAQTWVQGGLLAVLLGLFAAGIGLNVQHDGGHRAYSTHVGQPTHGHDARADRGKLVPLAVEARHLPSHVRECRRP